MQKEQESSKILSSLILKGKESSDFQYTKEFFLF